MLKIYITNLREYTEGKLVGEWVDLPLEEEELQEITNRISNNGQDELFISDYETDIGMTINEYDDIHLINEKASIYEYELEEDDRDIVNALLSNGYSFDDAMAMKDDCILYCCCNDMTDVAIEYCSHNGILNGLPKGFETYFDYETLGNDMEMEGTYIFHNGLCVQIL